VDPKTRKTTNWPLIILGLPPLFLEMSNVGSLGDLHFFFCTSRGILGLAADPVMKACWLTKHRKLEAVALAARKGGADVMIHLLRIGAVSATDETPYTVSWEVENLTPIEFAVC